LHFGDPFRAFANKAMTVADWTDVGWLTNFEKIRDIWFGKTHFRSEHATFGSHVEIYLIPGLPAQFTILS
jgi:hypothetical protein